MSIVWTAPGVVALAAHNVPPDTDAAQLAGAHEPGITRVRRGLAIPWNTYGNTSAGRLRARPGSLSWPVNTRNVKVLAGHRVAGLPDPVPIGYLAAARSTDEGLDVDIRFADTPAGQAALLEADEHVRDALSVELDDLQVEGDEITSGTVVALSLIPVPAFTDARLAAGAAVPSPRQPEVTTMPDTDTAVPPPAALPAESAPPRAAGIRTIAELTAAVVAANTGRAGPELRAALADITYTAHAHAQAPQVAGELWSGVSYTRLVVPQITNRPLTSMEVKGWKWTTPPAVAPYSGDKTEVPSNTPVTAPVTIPAERLAGAHDIDRKFFDFNDTEFIASYYQAMTDSYAKQSDLALAADLIAGATAATPAAGANAWATLLECYYAVLAYATPTFALVSADWAKATGSVTTAEAPAVQLPITPIPVPGLSVDVLVGAREGATFYELGSSPIRVEVVNLPNGGIDAGVFGYYATNVHQALAFAKADVPAPV